MAEKQKVHQQVNKTFSRKQGEPRRGARSYGFVAVIFLGSSGKGCLFCETQSGLLWVGKLPGSVTLCQYLCHESWSLWIIVFTK